MFSYVNILLIVIVFACTAFLFTNGLWGNMIMFINVILASLLAMNFFEPFSDWLTEQAPEWRFIIDFVALWAIFALSVAILRAATDQISKVNVRFKMPIERAGAVLSAMAVAWVMVCFTSLTLHTAPLGSGILGENLAVNPARFLGRLSPDVVMLTSVHVTSNGSMKCWKPNPFNDTRFFQRYGERRARYAQIPTFTVPENVGE